MMKGRILRGIGGFYTVKGEDGQAYTLRAQGKLRRQRVTPTVGDFVEFEPVPAGEEGWIGAILPRKNALIRPPVSNIDCLVVTVSAANPKADLGMTDMLLYLARKADIEPLLVINKADEDAAEAEAIRAQYAQACPVFVVSARTGEGLAPLREALKHTAHAFGGQSGVGKSTLINALYGTSLTTGSLSEKIERGRHTTRKCELLEIGDNLVLDTPGFSLLEMDAEEPLEVPKRYPEFAPYAGKCRFEPCAHDKEPGCAVRAAVAAGAIDSERYARYQALFEEMSHKWRDRYG